MEKLLSFTPASEVVPPTEREHPVIEDIQPSVVEQETDEGVSLILAANAPRSADAFMSRFGRIAEHFGTGMAVFQGDAVKAGAYIVSELGKDALKTERPLSHWSEKLKSRFTRLSNGKVARALNFPSGVEAK